MSETLKFCTTITDATKLAVACDRMRAAEFAVEGPKQVGANIEVRLPKWSHPARFGCDANGALTGVMTADNYSPYYDDRKIDNEGNRIPGTGRVHADVEAGRKRVGEDGRWGDIKYLDRLQQEYRAGEIEAQALATGGRIAYTTVDEVTGHMRIRVELPEEEMSMAG